MPPKRIRRSRRNSARWRPAAARDSGAGPLYGRLIPAADPGPSFRRPAASCQSAPVPTKRTPGPREGAPALGVNLLLRPHTRIREARPFFAEPPSEEVGRPIRRPTAGPSRRSAPGAGPPIGHPVHRQRPFQRRARSCPPVDFRPRDQPDSWHPTSSTTMSVDRWARTCRRCAIRSFDGRCRWPAATPAEIRASSAPPKWAPTHPQFFASHHAGPQRTTHRPSTRNAARPQWVRSPARSGASGAGHNTGPAGETPRLGRSAPNTPRRISCSGGEKTPAVHALRGAAVVPSVTTSEISR